MLAIAPVLVLFAGLAAAGPALGQGWLGPPGLPRPAAPPPPPPAAQGPAAQQQTCIRLEADLARIDRPVTAPPDPTQFRALEDAIGKQRFDLDRTIAQAQRLGCSQRPGFFLFGGLDRHPQCPQIEGQIAQMQQNLDRMMGDLQRARGAPPGPERDFQRRQVLAALAQNNCGPQYRAAAPQPQRPQNFIEMLFGGRLLPQDDEYYDAPLVNTYRTLCVRTCDGFYFPISFSATPSKFREDERICRAQCPAAEVVLYAHRNPGEDVSQALNINGRAYTELPNAFKYRQSFNPSCTCKPANQTWADAIGHLDDRTVQRGDIIVTEERSKQMQQQALDPKPQPTPPQPRQGERDRRQQGRNTPPQPAPDPVAQLPPPPEPAPAAPELRTGTDPPKTSSSGGRTVRAVGPTFYPVR